MRKKKRGNATEDVSKHQETESPEAQIGSDASQDGLPCLVVEDMKVLGITLNRRSSCGERVEHTLDRAKVRLAIMGSRAGYKWGAEVGLLRFAGEVLIISFCGTASH